MWQLLRRILGRSAGGVVGGIGTALAIQGIKSLIGAGGSEKEDEKEPIEISTQPTKMEIAEEEAMAPVRALIERAIEPNRPRTVVSDKNKKQIYANLADKFAKDEEITEDDIAEFNIAKTDWEVKQKKNKKSVQEGAKLQSQVMDMVKKQKTARGEEDKPDEDIKLDDIVDEILPDEEEFEEEPEEAPENETTYEFEEPWEREIRLRKKKEAQELETPLPDKKEEKIPETPLVKKVKEKEKADVKEINKQLGTASKIHLLGQLLGGALGVVGGAGGFGHQERYGVAPEKAAGIISNITSQAYLEKKRQLARSERQRLENVTEKRINALNALPLPNDEKQRLIQAERRNLETTTNRIYQAVGLGPGDVSDKKMKNIKPCGRTVAMMLRSDIELSDEDYKCIEEADPVEVARGFISLGKPYNGNELQFIHEIAKTLNDDKDFAHDIEDAGIWSPETLKNYAKFIKNSVYTYKPEATEIDPSIDPTEEHIGPMAQEIEKVNPACIIETEDGVKTVDTGRLSLMTSGVVADLARQNIEQGKAIEQLTKKFLQLAKEVG